MIEMEPFVLVSNKTQTVTQTILNNYGLSIVRTPGDGHCILHAFQSSWKSQIHNRSEPSLESMSHEVFIECVTNREKYLPFTGLSASMFVSEMRNYLLNKSYNSVFCDLIPLILANVFGVDITILNSTRGQIQSVEVSPASNVVNGHIVLFRSGEHYSGLRPSNAQTIRRDYGQPASGSTPFATHNKLSLLQEESDNTTNEIYAKEFPTIAESIELTKQNKASKLIPKTRKKKTRY